VDKMNMTNLLIAISTSTISGVAYVGEDMPKEE